MQYHTDQRERADAATQPDSEPVTADPEAAERAPEPVDGDVSPDDSRPMAVEADPVPAGSGEVATGVASPPEPAVAPPDRAGSPVAFQERWHDIQLRFVDDPSDAASQAEQLVAEVVDTISAMLSARKGEIDAWSRADQPDTEQLRQAIQRYRELLDQLVGIAETGRGGPDPTH